MNATDQTRKTMQAGNNSWNGDAKLNRTYDWRTTDQDEIRLRQQRAKEEQPQIRNLDPAQRVFSQFEIVSRSGMTYTVELRSVAERIFSCTCTDFRINGLGTCKHVEGVLLHLEARFPKLFAEALRKGSDRIDVVWDQTLNSLRVEKAVTKLPPALTEFFDAEGKLRREFDLEEAAFKLPQLGIPQLRISQEVARWIEQRRRRSERIVLRRDYEEKVQSGVYPQHETRVPLFPYQREGMLHLAFNERALLADEMGLGKTIQAIAACALLHRLGKAERVLVVTPASLKTEWEEQIQLFSGLSYRLVFGPRRVRLRAFQDPAFFTIVNYEQMVREAPEVNKLMHPDVVILDEAQRIKNWSTKTAQAIKRLQSRYAFVLTGTPIENRIDELYSIIDFLDPTIFGPLFRFNREFYELDERGRPKEYRNLELLHDRISPLLLRRRKADVETELPGRTDRNFFVPLNQQQRATYLDHEAQVVRLIYIAKRRPLTKQQQEKLMRELAMMRMICDTNYILDPEDRTSPKLEELERILEQCLTEAEVKVVLFSEWERMLELARDRLRQMRIGFAWHTGTVPQQRRRGEIRVFKSDPQCRVFLSTDSGGVGLNLQNASVVINCDLPWNPAKLEQRIARAWRKNQSRPVTVINLIAEGTIEHRMLGTLAAKKGLADGVLDRIGDLKEIKLKGGGQTFLNKLELMIAPSGIAGPTRMPPATTPPSADPALAFAHHAAQLLGAQLLACEERFPDGESNSVLVVVVDRDAATWREQLAPVYERLFANRRAGSEEEIRLEVIDRSTEEAIRRLCETGLVQMKIRATRYLHPPGERSMVTLSDEQRARIDSQRALFKRKLKMGRILAAEDLLDEARDAVGGAILCAARIRAVQARLPEPGKVEEILLPPLAVCWGESRPLMQRFLEHSNHEIGPIIQALESSLADDSV
ncbi:MAG: DEAD/DEAH box helicase family protein [Verrucomicrobia bacterium]|nr:DEAD/DEAH box helicase family protein [Verrucomicrobiota bacterium]